MTSIMAEIKEEMSLVYKVLKLKLLYFGRGVRSDGLEKTFMFGMGNGKRGRGRPRRRWMDEVVETTGLPLQQLKKAARDRVGWKYVVKSHHHGTSVS